MQWLAAFDRPARPQASARFCIPAERRSACPWHWWIACRTPTHRPCRSHFRNYFPFTRPRNASRRSTSSLSQRTLSERRSFDLRRSIPPRRSNPRRRSRPARRSASSQGAMLWRRSWPERDPPLSWISCSAGFNPSVSRLSLVAVIRFLNSLSAGLGAFPAAGYLTRQSKLCAIPGKGKVGLNSGLKQRPTNGLGQASYRVGKWDSIV